MTVYSTVLGAKMEIPDYQVSEGRVMAMQIPGFRAGRDWRLAEPKTELRSKKRPSTLKDHELAVCDILLRS